jgi:glycosyltransferase involved in cell wall biosynthesis
MTQNSIALLGRCDEPTDAVEEYCIYLGKALQAHDFDLQLVRVPWAEQGWTAALHELKEQAKHWHGQWVLVQYTALAWSARGFPHRLNRVMKILVRAGAKVGVVYHDVLPYEGSRLIDRVRRFVQLRTMRNAVSLADLTIFTVPAEKIHWAKAKRKGSVFIPVGANLPVSIQPSSKKDVSPTPRLTVAVFGITGGQCGESEIANIVEAMRSAATQVGPLRLVVLGRNSEMAEVQLKEQLRDIPIELRVRGLLSGEEVVRELSAADVLLFLRGHISTRRGSAIAGIACGLPVVACAGAETAAPITEAGLELYEHGKKSDFARALLQVLKDEKHRAVLAERSRNAQEMYFSWAAIAARYAEALRR